MKPCLSAIAFLIGCFAVPALAQTVQPPLPQTPPATLQVDDTERQFFELGITFSRAAFAYAELAKRATIVSKTRSKLAQVGQLGKLEPIAQRNRLAAHDGLIRTIALMRALHAPENALTPVVRASERLAGTLPLTPDAKPVAFFNGDAARTLSALNEFETLSSLPEDPALRQWLTSASVRDSAQVWYGEGEIIGLAQIAAASQMPDLLPPTEQLATDLRGLRDWLSLRLPDTPSPEQISLKHALDAFLQKTAREEPHGVKSRKMLTPAELQTLGTICQQLQAQVLGTLNTLPSAETAERA